MIRITGGTLVSIVPGHPESEVRRADLWVDGARIVRIGDGPAPPGTETVDASGCLVIPGLIQTHIHLCQTLFRNAAEDLQLLDWLRQRIWPLEAAHDPTSLAASARLGIAELLRGGTTAILDMGTVRHHEVVFEAARAAGLRYTGGKAMMDQGDGVPDGLRESTRHSLEDCRHLIDRYHGTEDGRLRFAFAPRFVLSCSRDMFDQVRADSAARDLLIHTHASENPHEIDAVRKILGSDNIAWFHEAGLGGKRLCLAHCVWATDAEIGQMAASGAHAIHCPSSNLKLASGIAPVAEMRRRGVSVSLGADGAPCNNRLDAFAEMRLCGLLAKLRGGPAALPARDVFEMATWAGAKTLGLGDDLGVLEPGRLADIVVLGARALHGVPWQDPFTFLVYAAQPADVREVMVHGRWVVRGGGLTTLDEDQVVHDAETAWQSLSRRM